MMAAATNFSYRRPELWPNISGEFWQLHDRGPNWPEATEVSPAGWARGRYHWSRHRVVGTTEDSNVWQPGGTWTLTVEPHKGGQSHRDGPGPTMEGQGLAFLCTCRPLRPTMESAEDVERADT
jgi:hypothetical protein